MRPRHWLGLAAVVLGLAVLFAVGSHGQSADPPAKPQPKVKELAEAMSGTERYEGVVDRIDADGLTLVVIGEDKEVTEYRFAPIDLLRKGEVLPDIWGAYAYRWQDVKRGDTVRLVTLEDKADGVTYCMEINIKRRPGAKLPESQNPKQDTNYAINRILNDLENGEDVSDEDIAKAFPPKKAARMSDGTQIHPAHPGGLSRDYQAKLDAIRAKKKDDPKAKPPEKKDDKK